MYLFVDGLDRYTTNIDMMVVDDSGYDDRKGDSGRSKHRNIRIDSPKSSTVQRGPIELTDFSDHWK